MKLTSVTIEGMHRVTKKTYDFKYVTYLHGPNGAGKSTVLQAVQLALLGYIPGTGKTKEAIFRHSNNHTMAVTVNLDDGGKPITVRRVWSGEPPKTHSSVSVTPEMYNIEMIVKDLELPIFNFNDFVGMTANNLKDWFISFLPKANEALDWDELLRKCLGDKEILDKSLIPSLVKHASELDASGVEQVRKMNEHMKSLLSFKKSELTRHQNTVQSLIFYDDESVQSASPVELRNRLTEISKLRADASAFQMVKSRREQIESEIKQIGQLCKSVEDDPEYVSAKANLSEANAEIDRLSEEMNKVSSRRCEIELDIRSKRSVISGKGVCPFTNNTCESISALCNKYEAEVAELELELSKVNNNHDTLRLKRMDAKASAKGWDTKLAQISSIYKHKADLENELLQLPAVDAVNIDVDLLDKEAQDINDMLVKISANERYNSLITELTSQKYMIEETILLLNEWIKLTSANGLQTDMMKAPFEAISDEMDNYIQILLGDNVSTTFYLSSKANSFSFGLTRESKYIPFGLLSSGERCLFTLALMMAIVNNSNSALKLIMIDDLLDHLDDDNIKSLFESLNNVEGIQLVFAGVKPYTGTDAENVLIEVK